MKKRKTGEMDIYEEENGINIVKIWRKLTKNVNYIINEFKFIHVYDQISSTCVFLFKYHLSYCWNQGDSIRYHRYASFVVLVMGNCYYCAEIMGVIVHTSNLEFIITLAWELGIHGSKYGSKNDTSVRRGTRDMDFSVWK